MWAARLGLLAPASASALIGAVAGVTGRICGTLAESCSFEPNGFVLIGGILSGADSIGARREVAMSEQRQRTQPR